NLFEMYDQNELSRMNPDLADQFRATYTSSFYPAIQWVPMSDEISYGLVSLRPVSELILRYKALFRCEKPMDRDWRLYVEASSPQGERLYWNSSPVPATSNWEPGEYYVLQRYVPMPPPGNYTIRLGFFEKEGDAIIRHGSAITAGDLSF
ncbi:MAG: hypothetical protein IT368_18905, partial [Candidatus Hydrogenedentes bacterium]|nr:hypothetical protein [Candidatus Hydrogenedentota bacterium]